MWGKIMIPMYRLWLDDLYGLYGPRCPLSPERPLNLITHSHTDFRDICSLKTAHNMNICRKGKWNDKMNVSFHGLVLTGARPSDDMISANINQYHGELRLRGLINVLTCRLYCRGTIIRYDWIIWNHFCVGVLYDIGLDYLPCLVLPHPLRLWKCVVDKSFAFTYTRSSIHNVAGLQ